MNEQVRIEALPDRMQQVYRLWQEGVSTTKDVASRLGVTEAWAGQILAGLRAEGLIPRRASVRSRYEQNRMALYQQGLRLGSMKEVLYLLTDEEAQWLLDRVLSHRRGSAAAVLVDTLRECRSREDELRDRTAEERAKVSRGAPGNP